MTSAYLSVVLSAAAFSISVISLFFFKSYLKRRTGQERILSELREEVDNILKAIDDTADRDISLMEEKEQTLRSLLGDIEKRLKVYIREMETRREAENASAALTPEPPGTALSGQSPGRTGYQELGKKRYRGSPPAGEPVSAPVTEDAAPAFPLPRFRVKTEGAVPPSSIAEQVRGLVKAGFDAPVIASRLGISIAEAEFAAVLLERQE